MIENFIIVDGHTHTYPTKEKAAQILGAFTTFYNMQPIGIGNGTIEEVVSNMQKDRIDYTVLANFAPVKILHQNNLWSIKISKKYNQLIPLVSIHPEMEGNTLLNLKNYISSGAKGIKIHSSAQGFLPNDARLNDIYAYCNEMRFPIFFHCGLTSEVKANNYSDLEMLMPVIDKYKDIPIVLGHMAEGKFEDVLWLAKTYQNIYFDTSIAISGLLCIKRVHDTSWQNDDFVIDIFGSIGASRIVFGSDYPFGSPIHDINRLIHMNLKNEEKSDILGRNALKIFSIGSPDYVVKEVKNAY